MFINADIGFKLEQALGMLQIMLDSPSYKILGGAYTKKTIAWEKVLRAAQEERGQPNPNNLRRFVGDFAVNLSKEPTEEELNQPWPVEELDSGFMMIHREAFEAYAQNYPEKQYLTDTPQPPSSTLNQRLVAYFETGIDSESQKYLSEDHYFCKQMAKIGYQSWLCPWVDLVHVGTYPFESHLSDSLSMGMDIRFKTPISN